MTQEELVALVARRRGEAGGSAGMPSGSPPAAPVERPSVLGALGEAAAEQFVPALQETGKTAARMVVPGYNLYETMTAEKPPGAREYSLAALNEFLVALPLVSAVKYARMAPIKGINKLTGVKGQRIPIKSGVEKAREAESMAHERVLTALRPDQAAKEYYTAAETLAKDNAEVYYAPRVAQSIESFLTKHAPTIRQKEKLLETFPKGYVEKTTTEATKPHPKLASTESAGMRSTQSIQQSEQFATGMERVFQDLAGMGDKLKASGSAVDPVDWKSVKNQVQSLYAMSKGDPRRGDLVPILRAFKEDLAAVKSPSSELMQRGDMAAQRQSALEVISEAALKNSKISTTPEGKAIRRVNANQMAKELVSPENKYVMETFSSSEREIMERTWGAISKIQELDSGSKATVSSALASVRVGDRMTMRMGEFAGQGVTPSRAFAIDIINTAMLLPGGAQMIRSVSPKGLVSQTGILMLTNFILSTARARIQQGQPPASPAAVGGLDINR